MTDNNNSVKIIYENNDIVVCVKPSGVLSEKSNDKKSMSDFFDYPIYCVHRLDKEVSGLMVYAKNKFAAASLSEQIQKGIFKKEYLAVIHGKPEQESGVFEDFLFKDSAKNKVFVVKKERKGVKKAKLEYFVLDSKDDLSFVRIKLYTGRTHQIRVQFASRKMPLFADKKYGGKDDGKIALRSYKISFNDIRNKNPLDFEIFPKDDYPFCIFEDVL